MNNVNLIGRLVSEGNYFSEIDKVSHCRFTLSVKIPSSKDGQPTVVN